MLGWKGNLSWSDLGRRWQRKHMIMSLKYLDYTIIKRIHFDTDMIEKLGLRLNFGVSASTTEVTRARQRRGAYGAGVGDLLLREVLMTQTSV